MADNKNIKELSDEALEQVSGGEITPNGQDVTCYYSVIPTGNAAQPEFGCASCNFYDSCLNPNKGNGYKPSFNVPSYNVPSSYNPSSKGTLCQKFDMEGNI